MPQDDTPPPPYSNVSYPTKDGNPPPTYDGETNNAFPPNPSFTPIPIGPAVGIVRTDPQPMNISLRTSIFGPLPVETDCKFCNAHIVTQIKRTPGTLPFFLMGVCFILGFFFLFPFCLCFVPFCIEPCLDVVHSCPSCKKEMGRFKRM
uniref:LITAF domain-containing protein n=1 Tax=Rhabditophanes sp. KR3021 TaxID=114890 RepID=A0AC35TQW6_9BILA